MPRESLILSIVEQLAAAGDLRSILANTASGIGRLASVSRCIVCLYDREADLLRFPVDWSASPVDPAQDRAALTIVRHFLGITGNREGKLLLRDLAHNPSVSIIRRELSLANIRSGAVITSEVSANLTLVAVLFDYHQDEFSAEAEIVLCQQLLQVAKRAIQQTQQLELLAVNSAHYRNAEEKHLGVYFDLDGIVRFVTRPFESATGFTSADLRGIGLESFVETVVHEADRSNVLRHYSQAIAARALAPSFEYRLRHAGTDKEIWLLDQFGPVQNDEGKIIGFEVFALDTTDRHLVEEQYRRTEQRYRRLVEHADAIIFHADPEHRISFISRRALDFFGVLPEDFVGEKKLKWLEFVHPDDVSRVKVIVSDRRMNERGFDEEFRVINRVTGRVRWLLMRLVPALTREGEVEGYDGFGIDISARREAQEALDIQSRKIRALYTVSSAIRGYLEPSSIANRGLAALCDATGAEAGVCYLYAPGEERELQLVAQLGFAAPLTGESELVSSLTSLSGYVARHGQSFVIPELESDARGTIVANSEGLHSAVLVPVATDDEVLGGIGLFGRKSSQFDGGTVMLVSAAANQIGLAARQANLFSLYQRQTKNLSALYRLSHEVSRNLSVDEIFQNAFTIIRDELGLKRLWVGLLNESGTRITGQAAFGPGWRRRLVSMNVEVSGRENPIARVVSSKKAIVLENADDVLREFGVRRILSRLAIHSVVLVPLISAGQMLGVLAAQPGADDSEVSDEKLTLLSSLANEIAAAVLACRLEERIGEAEKMRAAGLLAAGIAHNFNNVLQAIMGQASLLEMSPDATERTRKSARVISEASSKGAGLVKQLLSFAYLEDPRREVCDINDIIERHSESLVRLVQANQAIRLNLQQPLPRAFVDPNQLMRILTTITANASEAMQSGGEIEIFTDAFAVDHSRPHFEVPHGEYVRIGVRDQGSGMDEETRRRCFEPFFTTKNVDRSTGLSLTGAGLGLAAAYALSRRNDGRLLVESQLGHGSVFTLYVPVARGESALLDDGMHAEAEDSLSNVAGKAQIEVLRDVGLPEEPHAPVARVEHPPFSIVRRGER